MSPPPSVLFACIHNSGRSVAAQVLARHYAGDAVAIRSAGSEPGADVNPAVFRVTTEMWAKRCSGAGAASAALTKSAARMSAENRMIVSLRGWLDRFRAVARGRDEDLLDRQVKQLGNSEGERERGIVFAGLDRVHALPRDFEAAGEILLAPAALGAKDPEAVLHQHFTGAPRVSLFMTEPTPRPMNQMMATE